MSGALSRVRCVTATLDAPSISLCACNQKEGGRDVFCLEEGTEGDQRMWKNLYRCDREELRAEAVQMKVLSP